MDKDDLQNLIDEYGVQQGYKMFAAAVGHKQAAVIVDGQELTDQDGNPVTIDAIAIATPEGEPSVTEATVVTDGEAEEAEADDEEVTDEQAGISETVQRAVAAELQKIEKRAKNPAAGVKAMSSKDLPVSVKGRYHNVKAFSGNREEREYKAFAFGQVILASRGSQAAHKWLGAQGLKVAKENDDRLGGVLVPEEMSNDIIRLVEEFGVYRANANIVPMSSDRLLIPRIISEGSAAWIGEAATVTASDDNYDNVELVAKKLGRIQRVSNELIADSIISMADRFAQSTAQKFADAEDDAAFNGDGTSSYGGVQGLTVKINDGNHDGGIKTAATGNTAFSTLDLADFHGVTGLLPRYAVSGAKWYVSSAGFAESMERLAHAQGGVTRTETEQGSQLSFLGYPVEITQKLNSTTAADTSAIKLLFGNLAMASSMGTRANLEIATSADRYFDTDETAFRAIERVAINNHDLGDGTDAGPIVALKTPAS